MSSKKQIEHTSPLRYLILSMFISIMIVNLITLLLDVKYRHSFVLLILNIAAGTASSLGIIAIIRYGFSGIHGKSYLFLTIGIILWFTADIIVTYYFIIDVKELIDVSIVDAFYFMGYGFLSLHLFVIMKELQREINPIHAIIISIVTIIFVIYVVTNLLFSEFDLNDNFISIVVSLMYPILDLILIAPSAIILISLRKNYQQSIPWFLSSLSLFINAIADDGYAIDFVNGNSENLWVWELFYVADFIIMSGALYWYNKFHIFHHNKKDTSLRNK
ncbi:MAG TPA: hypothetical protein VF222_02580 [Nitrososphaeraceae archaeon]